MSLNSDFDVLSNEGLLVDIFQVVPKSVRGLVSSLLSRVDFAHSRNAIWHQIFLVPVSRIDVLNVRK